MHKDSTEEECAAIRQWLQSTQCNISATIENPLDMAAVEKEMQRGQASQERNSS